MNFDRILEEWEKRRRPAGPAGGRADRSAGGTTAGEDWLTGYLPDGRVVETKNSEDRIPVSEGRSVWLRRPAQDVLDLHGLNAAEARGEMLQFVRSMRRRGLRKGLIVHGKGLHSPEGSVLAPLVREFLEHSSEIGEFGRAGRKDGGSGASWFLLRQRSR